LRIAVHYLREDFGPVREVGRVHLPNPPSGHLLTYPIPGPEGCSIGSSIRLNIAPGDRLTNLLTDRNGFTAELTVWPGSVQIWHKAWETQQMPVARRAL
jgi:hypothetical protein